MYHKTFCVG